MKKNLRNTLYFGRHNCVQVFDGFLFKPNTEHQKMFFEERERTGIRNVKEFWFTYPNTNALTAPFAGTAAVKDDNTLTICASGYVIDQPEEYKRWIIRHELRHCNPTKDTNNGYLRGVLVRGHDIYLKDKGWSDRVIEIGFFWEDFEEIKCCDILMSMFRNLENLEDFL